MASDKMIAVTDEDGGVSFYAIDVVLDVIWNGKKRKYAVLISPDKGDGGEQAGMVLGYTKPRGGEISLSKIEDQNELDHVLEKVFAYYEDQGDDVGLLEQS